MSAELTPIQTHYKGYYFRSRLEARWAVFFDSLGITWEYEHQGFLLPDGTRYLPDFWLPTFDGGIFVEVKPVGGDFSKARALALASGRPVWFAEGTPDTKAYIVFYPNEDADDPGYEIPAIPLFDQAFCENRMFVQPGYENPDGTIPRDLLRHPAFGGAHLLCAVQAARSARFEHGANL